MDSNQVLMASANQTYTIHNAGSDEETTKWMMKYVGMAAVIWAVGMLSCVYHFCQGIAQDRERSQNRNERQRALEVKEERLEPAKREQTVKSNIFTKKVTKMRNNGRIEFAEESNKISSQEDSSNPNQGSCLVTTLSENDEIECGLKQNDRGCEGKANSTSPALDADSDDTNLEITCSVCLDVFEVGDELAWSQKLTCQHVFHKDCLISWLMKDDGCPYCRVAMIDDSNTNESEEECAEALVVDSSSSRSTQHGIFTVANGLVSLARRTGYNLIPRENLEIAADDSFCDESTSASETRMDEESLEDVIEISTNSGHAMRKTRKGSRKSGNYERLQSSEGDEDSLRLSIV